MLSSAVHGTTYEWLVVVALLPFVGAAVARSWGPSGVLAAQRALALVALDALLAVFLGVDYYTAPLLIALLPLLGASVSRARPTWQDRPLAWVGAVLMATPIVALAHMGPYLWAAWWFIGLFGAALLRGLIEPLVERIRDAWPAAREWWQEQKEVWSEARSE